MLIIKYVSLWKIQDFYIRTRMRKSEFGGGECENVIWILSGCMLSFLACKNSFRVRIVSSKIKGSINNLE
jgi:hypothetical protein